MAEEEGAVVGADAVAGVAVAVGAVSVDGGDSGVEVGATPDVLGDPLEVASFAVVLLLVVGSCWLVVRERVALVEG